MSDEYWNGLVDGKAEAAATIAAAIRALAPTKGETNE